MKEQVRMELYKVLVVDDDRAIRDRCREVAESLGLLTYTAENAAAAYRVIEAQNIDIVVLDIKLPGTNGLDVMRELKQRHPEILVIMVTTYASIPKVVQALREGAFDYVAKPFNPEELRILLERAGARVETNGETRLLREKLKAHNGFSGIIGRTPEMEKLYRIISKVAKSNHPVMIFGEGGTGKKLVARSIHFSGPHPEAPFIPVDCGALVPTLIESELFGYVKGAFSGAVRSKDGLLQIAAGGTVFLDEIGELPFDLQSKLLRAIQEKEIRPVGSTKRIAIDVRILAATNRNLEQGVSNGTFRKDLYFRLNVMNLHIPPLRERRQDIPILANHFLERINRSAAFDRVLSEDAFKLMMAYDWPGNVRELENCVERSAALSSGPMLHVSDMPSQVQNVLNNGQSNEVIQGGIIPIAELEKRAIMSALTIVEGDKFRAAELLGIGKTTLYRKLKDYRINN